MALCNVDRVNMQTLSKRWLIAFQVLHRTVIKYTHIRYTEQLIYYLYVYAIIDLPKNFYVCVNIGS